MVGTGMSCTTISPGSWNTAAFMIAPTSASAPCALGSSVTTDADTTEVSLVSASASADTANSTLFDHTRRSIMSSKVRAAASNGSAWLISGATCNRPEAMLAITMSHSLPSGRRDLRVPRAEHRQLAPDQR